MLREFGMFEILFGIITHYWNIHREGWLTFSPEAVEASGVKHAWALCKSCHGLIRKLIHQNQKSIGFVLDLGTVDLMLDQI
jgi:hypothetical protein